MTVSNSLCAANLPCQLNASKVCPESGQLNASKVRPESGQLLRGVVHRHGDFAGRRTIWQLKTMYYDRKRDMVRPLNTLRVVVVYQMSPESGLGQFVLCYIQAFLYLMQILVAESNVASA